MTDQNLFEALQKRYGKFTHDMAASDLNTKCAVWFTKKDDALSFDWSALEDKANPWVNPPYSRGMQRAFTAKGLNLANYGQPSTFLVQADPGAGWFFELWAGADIIDTSLVHFPCADRRIEGKAMRFRRADCLLEIIFLKGRLTWWVHDGDRLVQPRDPPMFYSAVLHFEPG